MRKRHQSKLIQGWGWLGDAAEEAAVEAMAPARRPKNASTATAPLDLSIWYASLIRAVRRVAYAFSFVRHGFQFVRVPLQGDAEGVSY